MPDPTTADEFAALLSRRRTLIGGLAALVGLAACSPTSDGSTAGTSTTSSATASGSGTTAGTEAVEATAGVDAFDGSIVHELALALTTEDYESAIAAYVNDGEKLWIPATATIDGSSYEQCGLRLKGNSTLRALTGDRGTGGELSSDAPEGLPWLLRLNRFVDGQTHEGYEDFVVRANSSTTALNEAVSLDLLERADLPSMRSMHVAMRVTVGDVETGPALRLVVEHPDDDAWDERVFGAEGALYKAESTGDWSYRGDDPAAYDDVFDQEAGSSITDLSPLIELLAFVDGADDQTFASSLGERLDVDAFARYLAMMDLLSNSDDIDGRGNNAYVWWDAGTGRCTIVPWDLNLSLGVTSGFGPGAGGEGAGAPANDRGRPGGGGSVDNPLVQRFLAVDAFSDLVEAARADLTERLFASGVADEVLGARAAVVATADLVDASTLTSETEAVRAALPA